MELVVFDLDGTLLDGRAKISEFTRETLQRMARQGIAYTVATGRMPHAANDLLDNNGFTLPQIFKNGVMIWQPSGGHFSHRQLLSMEEIRHILEAFQNLDVAPFILTVEPDNYHAAYHFPLRQAAERRLVEEMSRRRGLHIRPVAELPADADITNISALGPRSAIDEVAAKVLSEPQLVAYSGTAIEGRHLDWIDIHHSTASKGAALALLKPALQVSRIVCFGDSHNDLSMFEMADECYAPSNAKDELKAIATGIIGHHDEDGVAHYLRRRFNL